jgi:ATPase subunit of ABC transporter with duplicated ATPase domains
MRQFIGMIGDETTLGGLALSLCAPRLQEVGARLAKAEAAIGAPGADERTQLKYADALTAWGDAGGYELEVVFDTVAVGILGKSWDEVRDRPVRTLSGGQQKRFALDLLLRGDDEVLLLDEPDNFLDVPGKLWLEQRLRESQKTLLFVSHDRELLANTATAVVAVEGGSAWVHPGSFASWHEARATRHEKLDEDRRRWDEEHEKLRELVRMYQAKAKYNSDMATRLQSARTRLARFEADGPPPVPPKDQNIRMRLDGGRTGKRAVMLEALELTGLTLPFDFEAWYGDRIAVLGANGTGKSHLLRLLGRGGTDPEGESLTPLAPVLHEGVARLGARVVPGHFSQTHDRPELLGATLTEILWRGDARRPSLPRDQAPPRATSGSSSSPAGSRRGS